MSTLTCPAGHPSETADFCDYCGAKMAGAASQPGTASPPVTAPLPDAAAEPAATAAGLRTCPNCHVATAGTARFCEECGYDHTTGKVPAVAPASAQTSPATPVAPAAAGAWTATVAADRAYFEANELDGVSFPAGTQTRSFTLTGPQMRIGRASPSRGVFPEIDLSADPLDPGISHSHAVLTQTTTGSWLLADLGSTNGTYLNGATDPLAAGEMVSVSSGDRIHVGAWTTITVHAPGG
ncbi:MAG: hypothetical protein QOD41_1130 [Cryptosporangiaceae bacterium]|nr:hypothetical protein [Cryptosporangiaceae bacterium]